MIDLLRESPREETTAGIDRCRAQNRVWASTLVAHEEETDQLLSILVELPGQPDGSLNRHTGDCIDSLNLLQGGFRQIRLDMVCEEQTCTPALRQTCHDPRYGFYPLVGGHCRPLTDEFGRVKAGCCQLLTGLIAQNLI